MSITNMDAAVKDVVEIMRKGGIVLYPTDTVWGIGCDATNAEAVDKIYALKRSTDKKSMLVLCKDVDSVVRYVNKAPSVAFDVMEMSEKPLTAILPGAVNVATNLIPDEGTLGIRVPNHDFCHEVLRRFGKPIVSTSANISGEATPLKFVEISKEVIEGVDYVVDPRFEGKPTRKPSSIISFGVDGAVKIIRD